MDVFILMFLLYNCGMALSSPRMIYEYHVIHLKKTWFDAQQYCRQHYTDLATFRDMDDINSFTRPSSFTEAAWIGLFDDPASWKGVMSNDSNSWRWSVTGTTSHGGYQNWLSNEPDHYRGIQYCGAMENGLWTDVECAGLLPFVCFTGSAGGPKQYSHISTPMSWEDAMSRCRQNYTDLAMIEDESENTAVASVLVPNQMTWMGLYRQPWRWSDGSDSQFKHWLSGHPNNLNEDQHCVLEHKNRRWNDMPCSDKKKFICHKASLKMHTISVKLQSDVDLSDLTYSTQMTKKIAAILQDHGLTYLNVKCQTPPQKKKEKEEKTKSLHSHCKTQV